MSSNLEHIATSNKESFPRDEMLTDLETVSKSLEVMRIKLAEVEELVAKTQARIDASTHKIGIANSVLENPSVSHDALVFARQFIKSESRFPRLLADANAGVTDILLQIQQAGEIMSDLEAQLSEIKTN